MGTGEDIVIGVLYVLQECPPGSLVVIEEIEVGLHPEATSRLAEELQVAALAKHLQVVVSSHSYAFLDAVPRNARVLLEPSGNDHVVIPGPTARFALATMAGVADPELFIYCEDEFAGAIIKYALPSFARRRVKVIAVGSNSAVAKAAATHMKAGFGPQAMVVWDGDVTAANVEDWLKPARAIYSDGEIAWAKLPGNCSPEEWTVSQLANPGALSTVATELGADNHQAILEQARAVAEHDIVFTLAQAYNVDEWAVQSALCKAAAQAGHSDLNPVVTKVVQLLDKHVGQQAGAS